eukprot:gene16566-18512_t
MARTRSFVGRYGKHCPSTTVGEKCTEELGKKYRALMTWLLELKVIVDMEMVEKRYQWEYRWHDTQY